MIHTLRHVAWCLFGALVVCLPVGVSADDRDWTYWRGPEFNGISRETGLPERWDPAGGEGSNLLWKRPDCGSRSTPIVMNGKIYFLAGSEPGTPHEASGERVVCLDAATGKTIWQNKFNVWLSDVPITRVGWSSVVGDPETGHVYALGVCDFFQCLDGNTGRTLWSKSLHEEFGMLSTYGGRTNFPIIFEDLVIINGVVINWGDHARPRHTYLAFDKRTGECAWMNGTTPLPKETTYSAPVLTTFNGQKALVFGSGDGYVWAVQPRTGQPIWKYQLSARFVNVAPLVVGNTVFAGHSEENRTGTTMGAIAAINGGLRGDITETGELWKNDEMMVGKSSPVFVDGRLYCFDDSGKGFVLDGKTGEMIGRRQTLGTIMRASPLFADGKVYIGEQNGRWAILQPDDKAGFKILSRGKLEQGEEIHASAIASHGRVYIMTTGCLYCLQDPSQQPGSTPIPPQPQESPVSEDTQPAHVQLIPAELLVRPGDKQQFHVRVYNARGQRLPDREATFSVSGSAQMAADGMFQASSEGRHEACYVTAKVGELTGQARVRIVPALPWHFDFEGLTDAPITWVGARYRHVIRKIDGNTVMVKITTIPLGMKSRCWFGQPDLHDYTIQADVRGSISEEKMPDIGLIAQGYTLDMKGVDQKLQIRAWDAELRVEQTVDFPWQPNTWYTMKFQVATVDGKSQLRGKVWPRGDKEPAEWTVQIEDTTPNLTGSPGLFGNATNAEIFLDNISVEPNS